MAEQIAVLDHLTQGRYIAGFARGYQDRWTNVLGQQYHVTGAPGEIGPEGGVRAISVVAGPYTLPHPEIWQPFSVSESTIRWCAREDIVPFILISHPPVFRQLCEAYRDEAEQSGRSLPLGGRVDAFRAVHVGDSREEAYALGARTQGPGFIEYFSGFGFMEAFRFPGETNPVPNDYQRLVDSRYALYGTADDIWRELDALRRNVDVDWFAWFFDEGMMPLDEAKRQIERFATQVMPEFQD